MDLSKYYSNFECNLKSREVLNEFKEYIDLSNIDLEINVCDAIPFTRKQKWFRTKLRRVIIICKFSGITYYYISLVFVIERLELATVTVEMTIWQPLQHIQAIILVAFQCLS